MVKWTYGEEGEAFPVRDGEVWRCGRHTFVCNDLMKPGLIDELIAEHHPDLMYTDPPWNQGNLNSFRTKSGLDKASYRWEDLYRRIAQLANGRPLWIEGSKPGSRDGDKIVELLKDYPGTARASVEVKYYRKHPSGLYYAGRRPAGVNLLMNLQHEDDDNTPGIVMRAYAPRGVVVDPCAGRGQTSREAERSGWSSLNLELNPNRVSAALHRMRALIGEEPIRVS